MIRYSYCLNNPLKYTDPTGMYYTWYVDGDNNVLLHTNDGSNDIVRVPNEKVNTFKRYADDYESNSTYYDNPRWNDAWKNRYGLSDIQLTGKQVAHLGMLHSDKARESCVQSWLNSNAGNFMSFVLDEIVAQWKTPELVIAGLSAGFLGWQAMGNGTQTTNIYRVFGNKSPALGYYWTPVNPRNVKNYRNAAGLPLENSGRFVIKGKTPHSNIQVTPEGAAPLGTNKGGLQEYLILDPSKVTIERVSGVNPPF